MEQPQSLILDISFVQQQMQKSREAADTIVHANGVAEDFETI